MNEELRQKALKFNEAEKKSFNALISGGYTPDESVSLIIGGQDTDKTFKEQAGEAVDKIGQGFKDIGTLKGRKLLSGTANIIEGGLGMVGATLETADDVLLSGSTGRTLTKIVEPIVNTDFMRSVATELSEFDKKTDGVAGDVLTIASVLPITKGLKVISKIAKEGEIISKLKTPSLSEYFNKIKTPAEIDTLKGIGQNIKQRVNTNIKRVKELGKESKELAKLPEVEAQAIRGGVNKQDISTFKEIIKNKDEARVVKEMFDNASKEVADKTAKIDSQREILGKEFLKPIEFLTSKKEMVGKELGEIRKNLDTTNKINTNKAYQDFYKMLTDKYGAKINKNEFIIDKTGASGSLEKATVDALKPQLQKLYSQTFTTQKDLDNWLKSTLNEFDVVNAFDKVKAPDTATRIMKDTRGIYKQLMPEEYNKALENYAKVSTPLGNISKSLKITQNIDDLTVKELKAGEIARRLGGNASADLKEIIDSILKVAEEYGYTDKVNLNRLAIIADDIDKMYDINRVTSLRGDVATAVSLPPTSATGILTKIVEKLLGGNYSKEETRALLKKWFDEEYLKTYEN